MMKMASATMSMTISSEVQRIAIAVSSQPKELDRNKIGTAVSCHEDENEVVLILISIKIMLTSRIMFLIIADIQTMMMLIMMIINDHVDVVH